VDRDGPDVIAVCGSGLGHLAAAARGKANWVGVAREHQHQIRKTIRKDPYLRSGCAYVHPRVRVFTGLSAILPKLDKDMYAKVLQPPDYDVIVRFPQCQGVDPPDLKERQNSIVTSGVYFDDLSLQADAVALGAHRPKP
jgi:hypothetical protein